MSEHLLKMARAIQAKKTDKKPTIEKSTINCWEFKACKKENTCPAATMTEFNGYFGGTNGGRFCAFIEGTECGSGHHQSNLNKFVELCIGCEFYKTLIKECLPNHRHHQKPDQN